MPFIAPELIIQAKQMDLLTYLKNYEPYELVKFSGKDFNDFLCMQMGIYNKKTYERNEER